MQRLQGSLKYKYILEKLSKINPIVEEIREALHKKVDVLEINQLKDNLELTQEILKDGIKIYG